MPDNSPETTPQEQPGVCPKCGRPTLIYIADEVTIHEGHLGLAVLCREADCTFTGVEWHKTTFLSFTDRKGNPIEQRKTQNGQA